MRWEVRNQQPCDYSTRVISTRVANAATCRTNSAHSGQIGLGDAIPKQEHRLRWITTFRCPDQTMRVRPALMNGQGPLRGDLIVSGRRIDEVCSANAPLGQVRGEEGHQSKIVLQFNDRMDEKFDIIEADGLVRLVNRHVVKDRLVNRAFVVRCEILRRDSIAAQEQRRKSAGTALSRIESAATKTLIMDPVEPGPGLDLMRVRSRER